MIKKTFKIALFLSMFAVASSLMTVKFYEDLASRSFFINLSKRAVAQTAAFLTDNLYDPYGKKAQMAHLGPKFQNPEELILTPQQLRENISIDPYLKSRINIIQFENRLIPHRRFSFDFQPYNNIKLRLLRKKYMLDEVVKNGRDDLEKFILLRRWVKSCWEKGYPENVSYNFDALDILDRAKKGENFFCSEYSTVYVQCALSLGLQARYVGLYKGHVVAEVWSDDFQKWIVMDVDNDFHYIFQEIPLNSLDLHRAWRKKDFNDIEIVTPEPVRIVNKETEISYYESFYVRMRNDWFSNKYPHWYPKSNSIMNGVEWVDVGGTDSILCARETDREADVYFPLNITSLGVKFLLNKKTDISFLIYLETLTPNFAHFDIQTDQEDFIKKDGSPILWSPHPGLNFLKVRAVNQFGLSGSESSLVVNYKG